MPPLLLCPRAHFPAACAQPPSSLFPPSPCRLNAGADLGLNFDFEILDDLSAQTRTPADSAPGSPSLTSIPAPTGLPLGKLNLKLNHGAVAASWQARAGDAPVFAMSAGDVVTAASGIPSTAAVAASLAVGSQDGWAASGLDEFVPVRAPKPAPRPAAPRPPMAPRPPAPRPPRKSSSKRRGGSKASDKRPRIKGRFVTREELDRHHVDRENGPAAAADAEDAKMALVPDTDLAFFFDHEAPVVW